LNPIVAARHLGADASDEAIREALFAMLDDIDGLAASLGPMKLIAVKSNIGIMDARLHRGRQTALTDPSVVAATIAWMRSHTDAEIVVGDATTDTRCHEVADAIGLTEPLARSRARIVDYNDEPYTTFSVPDGGLMFREYIMSEYMAAADAVVSLAKMKSHLATGATLTMKNLFGIPPCKVYGTPRRYLHAAIRLPRVLADIGLILRPTLNVIDGIVGQTQKEWHGPPVDSGWLIAGNNTVATDAVGMTVMGVDPAGDYPDSPFHFDRNPVLLASERGLGPVDLDLIDVRGDELFASDAFYSDRHMEPSLLDAIRRSVAEQAEIFQDRRGSYIDKYAGEIIGLYDGEVIHSGKDLDNLKSRGAIAREQGRRDKGLYLKKVVPEPEEIETYSVYETLLAGARA
jgi:uncharacterized protein (DUF362 family)